MNFLYKPTNTTKYEDSTVISIDGIINGLKSDEIKATTQKIRLENCDSRRRELKKTLPSFLPSICALHPSKKISNGVMQFDVDLKDNDQQFIAELNQEVSKLPNIFYSFFSPSGGLKFAVYTNFNEIVSANTQNYKDCYKEAYQIIAEKVFEKTGLFKYDPSANKIIQSCFLAYNENAFFKKNPNVYCFTPKEVDRILALSVKPDIQPIDQVDLLDTDKIQNEVLHLLEGISRTLSFDERLPINFTVLYYFKEEGIQILKNHWVVDNPQKLDVDLRSQLKSCKSPRLNYLKTMSSNFIPAKNTLSEWKTATPSKEVFHERDDIGVGREKLNSVIDDFFDNPRNMVVRAPCGTGKSTYTAKLLARSDMRVLYLAPTHALAEEVRLKVISEQKALNTGKGFKRKFRPNPTHLFGRSSIGTDGVHMCENKFARKKYLDKNTTIPNEVCQKCPFNPCRYILQFEELSRIRFSTHIDLQNNPSNWENGSHEKMDFAVPKSGNWEPNIIIIDESFLMSKRQELTGDTNFQSLKMVLEAALQGENLVECIIKFSSQIRIDYKKYLTKKAVKNKDTGEDKKNTDKESDEVFLNLFSDVIKKKGMTDGLLAVCFDKRSNPTRLIYDPLPNIHTRFSKTPVLVFDATANEDIYQKIIPDHEFIQIDACPHPSFKVFQCQNLTFSKNDFIKSDDLVDRVVADMARKVQHHKAKKVGLISYKNIVGFDQDNSFSEHLASKLDCTDTTIISHFGNIRGMNHFDDCDILFVVGRHAIQENSLFSFLQQIRGHKLFDNSMGFVERPARFKEGDAISFSNYSYMSPELRMVSDAFGTAETIQAIFRLRPFGDREKIVYFYSNWGLGADVSIDDVFDVEIGDMAVILENFRSKGFCRTTPSALMCIGFNDSQSRAGRREEIFRHLEQRGISRICLSLKRQSKPISHEYLVHNMDLLESHLARQGYQIVSTGGDHLN